MSRAAGLTIRSRCRWRTSASGSASPRCLSGNGCRHFAVSVQDAAAHGDRTPRDVITSPSTPTWSPRSTTALQCPPARHRAGPAQHHLQSPDQSRRVANQQFAVVAQQHHPAGDRDLVAGPASGASRMWVADRTATLGYGRSPAGTGRRRPRAARQASPAVPAVCSGDPGDRRHRLRRGGRRPTRSRRRRQLDVAAADVHAAAPQQRRRLGTTTNPSAMPEASADLRQVADVFEAQVPRHPPGRYLTLDRYSDSSWNHREKNSSSRAPSRAAPGRRRSGPPPRTPPGTPRSSARSARRRSAAPRPQRGHHELDQPVVAGPVAAHQVQRQAGAAPTG